MIHLSNLIIIAVSLLGLTNAAPEQKIVDGVTYHILRTPADSVRILWKDSAGKPLRTFPDAARHLEGKGLTIEYLGFAVRGVTVSSLVVAVEIPLVGGDRRAGIGGQ